ncbi:methionine ABC transporter permease [Pectinatus haikarae]|uniref:methionine ABC transporter permease n=1 Tax=Pectinatus haikarae TaxID=349096 RepID=UPI0018C5BF9D|nr:methionine ABC transporter permease [Pectinatus haikarae]
MSLRTHSLYEVLVSAFGPDVWKMIIPAIGDTLYMVFWAAVFTLIIGICLGFILTITADDGLLPLPLPHRVLGAVINGLRSLPEIIMIILMLPIARVIVGKSYGTNACIIALVASCVPMYARLVQGALAELSKGKIEAAKAMGSGIWRIIFSVMLPESVPTLIHSFTVALVAIISMTALAGSFGAGGLGDIAVRYGFNRFQHDVLIATVTALVLIVQAVQFIGDLLAHMILRKRHML